MVDVQRVFGILQLVHAAMPYRHPRAELRRLDMTMAYLNGVRDGIVACGEDVPKDLHLAHARLQEEADKMLAQIELHK
jgi:hypothetical protein